MVTKLSSKALTLALGVLAFVFAGQALADDQYVDQSGFAVSGADVVAYFSLKQAPVGSPQPLAVPGKKSISAEYNGATFLFSTAENRDKFVKNPAKYAPQYGGYCAFGVRQGGKIPANPHLWRIVDGKLYLNVKDTVVTFWEKDIPGNITLADEKWPTVSERPDVRRNAPGFDPNAFIQG